MKRILISFLVLIVAAVFTAPVYGQAENISIPQYNDWWVYDGDYIKNLDGENQVYAIGGDLWRNTEVYSDLAIDPTSLNLDPNSPEVMVEFHIQDRWSNGCGFELGMVRSILGGGTGSWHNLNDPGVSPEKNGFQICKPLREEYGREPTTYIRPSNPWLAWGKHAQGGSVLLANYALMEFGKNPDKGGNAGPAVSRSEDGGINWSIWIAKDHLTQAYPIKYVGPYSDYQTITFDPKVLGNVYAAWMRIQEEPGIRPTGPLYFSKSTDYGKTWSNPKLVYAPGASPARGAGHGNCWIGNILVNPVTGRLHLFTSRSWFYPEKKNFAYEDIAVLTSDDQGKKWSPPKSIHPTSLSYYYDQDGETFGDFKELKFPYEATEDHPVDNPGEATGEATGRRWRNNAERMNVAALPIGTKGVLYCVFQSRALRGGDDKRPVCALARSENDGDSWEIMRIDQAGNAVATLPRVAAAGDKVGVSYWDTADDKLTTEHPELTITYRLAVYEETGSGLVPYGIVEKISEEEEEGPISNDLRSAPIVSRSFFIGEHMGLQAVKKEVVKDVYGVYFHTTFPQIYRLGPAEDETALFDGDTVRIFDDNRIDMFYKKVGPYLTN